MFFSKGLGLALGLTIRCQRCNVIIHELPIQIFERVCIYTMCQKYGYTEFNLKWIKKDKWTQDTFIGIKVNYLVTTKTLPTSPKLYCGGRGAAQCKKISGNWQRNTIQYGRSLKCSEPGYDLVMTMESYK